MHSPDCTIAGEEEEEEEEGQDPDQPTQYNRLLMPGMNLVLNPKTPLQQTLLFGGGSGYETSMNRD